MKRGWSTGLAAASLLAAAQVEAGPQPQVACEHGVCFRFPGEEREVFVDGREHLGGPWHFDNGCPEGGCYCNTYWGADFDHCYRGHRGTDYMLDGAFRTMHEQIEVVAPADGEVVEYVDENFDRCHFSVRDLLLDPSHDGNYCGWEYNPETGEIQEREVENNYVIVRHFNGRYYVYSRILHIMQGSVPTWIRDSLAQGIMPHVSCGDPIAFVGSAGKSYAPHIHFEARTWGESDTDGLFWRGEEKPPAIDPYCGPEVEGGGRSNSMWTSLPPPAEGSTSPYGLPGLICQAPYDPAEWPSLPGRCWAE